uniref:Uncharacterized protein n=1 Tax=Lepeophtheirus salmonis TaxID=72036 RepID=A0A0K2T0U4_LEPSM
MNTYLRSKSFLPLQKTSPYRQNVTRVAHGRKLRNDLKSHGIRIIFYSDEKQWTVDRSHTIQNDIWLATKRANILQVFKTKFPGSIGGIGNNGNVMPRPNLL